MPNEKDHLAVLAQHKTQTQARCYRVYDKVVETDLGCREESKLVALKSTNVHQPQEDLKDSKAKAKPWKDDEMEQLKDIFKEDLETGAIEEGKLRGKLSTTNPLDERPLKAVVLKLRRMREERTETSEPPSEEEASQAKILRFLGSVSLSAPPPSTAHTLGSVSAKSSRFWRKFTDEQSSHLFSLTKDLIENNAIKKEVVWKRVKGDKR